MKRWLGLLVLMSSSMAHAGDKPNYAPPPDWVTPAPPLDMAKVNDASPVFLIMDQQQRLQDGRTWLYMDGATRIASTDVLNGAGTIRLPWSPDYGDLTIHRVEILRGGDRIDVLAGGRNVSVLRREEQLDQLQVNGMLTATLAVEGLRLGDVLRVSFSMTMADPALAGRVQTLALLPAEPMRIGFGRVRMLWPETAKMRWKSHAKDAQVRQTKLNGFQELSVALPLTKQVEMPNDAPLRFRPPPLIEATSFADWADVSRTFAPLYRTDGLIADGNPLAAEVAAIVAASSDPRTRAAMALRLVQDKVRYLLVTLQGGNYVPKSPAETWSLRYGDCKAKTLLLLALLRALNVEAEAVLVSSGAGDLVPDRLAMPAAFDHVLVRARVNGQSLWLDGTQTGTRAADLGDTPPFRNALPLRMAGAGLETLPLQAAARPDADIDLMLDSSAGLNLPALYTIKLTLRGPHVETLKLASQQANKEQKVGIATGLVAAYLGSPSIIDQSFQFDDTAATAVVIVTGIVQAGWQRENRRLRMPLDRILSQIEFAPDRARPAWSTVPVATNGPYHQIVHTRVRLPNGAKGFAIDGDAAVEQIVAGIQLRRTTSLADGMLSIDERAIATGAEIAPQDLAAARAQYAQARARLPYALAPADYPARWQQAMSGRGSKELAALKAAYAKAIANEPDQRHHYTNRASFLIGIYEPQAALADLGKAIALEADVPTYLQRAAVYQTLGDDAKALNDLKSAQALDPGSDEVLMTRISFHADRGELDQALPLVTERIAAGGKDKPRFLAIQAQILAENGKVQEGLAIIDAAIAAGPSNPELLNGRCWIKGVGNVALESALKDCTKAIELSDSPAAPLDSRAMVYFRMGRMEDALADLDAALDTAPGMPASLYLRGVVRKRIGHAAADADLTAARTMVPQIDADYAKFGIKP